MARRRGRACWVSGLAPTSIPLGDGLLCLQTQVRYAPLQLDAQGRASYSQLGSTSLAGSTIHYQFAFRDAGALRRELQPVQRLAGHLALVRSPRSSGAE